MKTVWQCPLKLSIYIYVDPAILFLGIYPREMSLCLAKDMCMHVHISFIYNSQKLETILMSNSRSDDGPHNGMLHGNEKE